MALCLSYICVCVYERITSERFAERDRRVHVPERERDGARSRNVGKRVKERKSRSAVSSACRRTHAQTIVKIV